MEPTISIRISLLNKIIIEREVLENFQEDNNTQRRATLDELISFLLSYYFSHNYNKVRSKWKNELDYASERDRI